MSGPFAREGANQRDIRERLSKATAIVNQKGGVGKSTTAVNLSACLADDGMEVLLIDLDPQGNATSGIGLDKIGRSRCVYDALVDGQPLAEIVERTSIAGLSAVPATLQLAGAEIELVSALSREQRLRKGLDPIKKDYDFVIVDCPPSLGLLTVNALTAVDEVIIPVQCEYYALEGLSKLLETIRLVKANLNPSLRISGVLMTMFDQRTKLSQQVVDEVRGFFKELVYDIVVPRTVRLSEAPSHGLPITRYDPASKGAIAYRKLAKEVISRAEKGIG